MRAASAQPAAWTRVAFAIFAVGWGANQFAPLMLVYRSTDHLSQTLVTSMFAAYVLGLVPALIGSAALAGRLGHRAILRPVMVGSALASVVLALGHDSSPLLFLGRVLYGVATGAAMAPGTTWVKELSADRPAGTGARRAAMSLSAGFCLGPVCSGLMAQYLPAPKVLPYVVHLVLTAVAAAWLWGAPERADTAPEHVVAAGEQLSPHAARSGHFWGRIAPMAPWVFGFASTGLVTMPSLVAGRVHGHAVAFSGLMAGVTLGVGVAVQQPARGLESRRPGSVSLLGMIAGLVGLLLTVWVAHSPSPWLALLAGAVLGCGYGGNLVGGLTRVEHAAAPAHLAMTNAVFYSLTYVGFFLPTAVAALSSNWPMTTVLLGSVALAVASGLAALAARGSERRTGARTGQ